LHENPARDVTNTVSFGVDQQLTQSRVVLDEPVLYWMSPYLTIQKANPKKRRILDLETLHSSRGIITLSKAFSNTPVFSYSRLFLFYFGFVFLSG
jgi:hypothetical protein